MYRKGDKMNWSSWVGVIIALAVVFGFFDNKNKKKKEKK